MIVKEYNIFEKGINAIVVTVGLLLCIWTATTMKATVATAIGLIPFLLTFIFICIKRPTILLLWGTKRSDKMRLENKYR